MPVNHAIFITGASGVGKSSLVTSLKSDLDHSSFDFHHSDAFGDIPNLEEMTNTYGSPSEWQKQHIIHWIGTVLAKPDKKIPIFEGQSNIDFIEEGFQNTKQDSYEIVLLDCQETEMQRRLIDERDQPTLCNKDMVNWLNFLRNQAVEKGVKIIDTTRLTIEETTRIFIHDVLKKSK